MTDWSGQHSSNADSGFSRVANGLARRERASHVYLLEKNKCEAFLEWL